MTDETTAPQGGAAVAAGNEPAQQPAPKSDAEAAQREAANPPSPEPADAEKAAKAEADKQSAEKKRNRTKEYIDRINGRNAELERRIAEYESRERLQQRPAGNVQQQQRQGPPTLEDHNFDFAAWSQANDAYNRQQWSQEQAQQAAVQHQLESQAKYAERALAFADQHPDFVEAVGSIDPAFLTPELQAAIIGHENGPAIAYELANNDDALWNLASVRADLLPAAVARFASRLGAAPPPAQTPTPAPAMQTPQPAALPIKPISQAPAPVPTVGGRSPTETPPEKLTDDEWYRRDVERRRKR